MKDNEPLAIDMLVDMMEIDIAHRRRMAMDAFLASFLPARLDRRSMSKRRFFRLRGRRKGSRPHPCYRGAPAMPCIVWLAEELPKLEITLNSENDHG